MTSPFFEFIHLADWENDEATKLLMSEMRELYASTIEELKVVNPISDPAMVCRLQERLKLYEKILNWSKEQQKEIDKKDQNK
jgi:hypothetical protein